MLSRLLDVIAPPGCLVCFSPLEVAGLCPVCRARLPWLDDPCPRCALPRSGGRCDECPARRAAFASASAAVAHADAARELVLAFKLRGALAAADLMAAQLVARTDRDRWTGTLVPVPADPLRRRLRGFDAAERLAEALGRRTGLPVERPLARAHGGAKQARRRGRDRRTGPLEVRLRSASPRRAMLVDDVHTTGATLHACALALASGGAIEIHAATYARTLRRA